MKKVKKSPTYADCTAEAVIEKIAESDIKLKGDVQKLGSTLEPKDIWTYFH